MKSRLKARSCLNQWESWQSGSSCQSSHSWMMGPTWDCRLYRNRFENL